MEGVVSEWNDERGFGFIESSETENPVFFHISVFEATTRRPQVGDELRFVLGHDDQKRLKAIHAAYLLPRTAGSSRDGIKPTLLLLIVSCAVLLLMAFSSLIPRILLAATLILSPITYLFYGRDKVAAATGRWRTSESTLQLLALLGGWPGALIAQRQFRHKTRKTRFQLTFFFMSFVNCAIIGLLVSNPIHQTFPEIERRLKAQPSTGTESESRQTGKRNGEIESRSGQGA